MVVSEASKYWGCFGQVDTSWGKHLLGSARAEMPLGSLCFGKDSQSCCAGSNPLGKGALAGVVVIHGGQSGFRASITSVIPRKSPSQ